MSEEIKEKKPMGKFAKNAITGLIISAIVWIGIFVVVAHYGKAESAGSAIKTADGILAVVFCAVAIILGSIGYVLMKLYVEWVYTHFVFFTRSPLRLLIDRFIVCPLIGVVGFPLLIVFLFSLIGKK